MLDPPLATAPAELRQRLDATALQRLRVAMDVTLIFAVLGIAYFFLAHPDVAPLLTAGTLVGAAGALAIRIAIHRNRVDETWASALGSGVWAIGISLTALGFFLTSDFAFTVFAAVLILASAVIHLFRRWLLSCMAFALAIWMPVGFLESGHAFLFAAVALIAVCTLSIGAHEILVRYFVQLEAMRYRELAHQRERERLNDQLNHSQKLEAVGTLAGGVAHDMNNVLAAIVGIAELLREDVTGAQREDVERILESAQRGAELTRNLLGFSRRDKSPPVLLRVAPLVESAVQLLRRTLPKGVEIELSAASDECIRGNVSQLTQALINLSVNASDAMNGHGVLRIELGRTHVGDDRAIALGISGGEYVTLAVADTGSGMTAQVKARAFEPFFTTKPQGRGTGLGLAMVYGTAKRHDGAVSIDSELGRGTRITMYLPSAPDAELPAAEVPAESRQQSGLVLVVDDDDAVRGQLCRHLKRAGYDVLSAVNGREALEVFGRRFADIDVVVLDMSMPVMGGAECFAGLKALDPDVRVLLASGYANEADVRRCLEGGALAFLDKPFAARQLLDAVMKAIRGESIPPRP